MFVSLFLAVEAISMIYVFSMIYDIGCIYVCVRICTYYICGATSSARTNALVMNLSYRPGERLMREDAW